MANTEPTQEPQLPALPPETAVVEYVGNSPKDVFKVDGLFDLLVKVIEQEIADFKPDLSTVTSRKDIAALSFKVARTKTALVQAGKDLTEDHRKAVAAINAQRNTFEARLQALQDKARKPLTDWEEAEAAREKAAEAVMSALKNAGVVLLTDTAAMVRQRIVDVTAMELDPAVLGPAYSITAPHIKETTIKALKEAYARLVQSEKEAAELKQLRDAEEARKADEAARENAANAEAEKAARETARLQEVAAAEERGRQAAEEARQAEERQRIADEEARRANEEHRNTVLAEVVADITKISGISKKAAGMLAQQMADGSIRHVKVEF